MKIRQKILVYFSVLSIAFIGTAFIVIYLLLSNYRTEDFQQRIKDKTITTLKFLVEINQIDHDLLQTMDKHTIHKLFIEKVLIFDNSKKLIYASIDDTKIEFPHNMLSQLSADHPEIELQEGRYDVVGIFFNFENKNYYAIAKAFDKFGYSKLDYLKYVLIFIFLIISSVILISSFLLSNQIALSINRMAAELKQINFNSNRNYLTVPKGRDEINTLATRFNELMKQLEDSISFQKYAIHHISHELKTPIAILVSNFERIEKENDLTILKEELINQKEDTKHLSNIIDALLEISKVEAGNKVNLNEIRVDEIIFDVIEELKGLHESFNFIIDIDDQIDSERMLTIIGNENLLRMTISNLAINCIQYSSDNKALVKIFNVEKKICIEFINSGPILLPIEKEFIFQHFFRGENSMGKRGFGLGLVFVYKIIELHHGKIEYYNQGESTNVFKISLPLS